MDAPRGCWLNAMAYATSPADHYQMRRQRQIHTAQSAVWGAFASRSLRALFFSCSQPARPPLRLFHGFCVPIPSVRLLLRSAFSPPAACARPPISQRAAFKFQRPVLRESCRASPRDGLLFAGGTFMPPALYAGIHAVKIRPHACLLLLSVFRLSPLGGSGRRYVARPRTFEFPINAAKGFTKASSNARHRPFFGRRGFRLLAPAPSAPQNAAAMPPATPASFSGMGPLPLGYIARTRNLRAPCVAVTVRERRQMPRARRRSSRPARACCKAFLQRGRVRSICALRYALLLWRFSPALRQSRSGQFNHSSINTIAYRWTLRGMCSSRRHGDTYVEPAIQLRWRCVRAFSYSSKAFYRHRSADRFAKKVEESFPHMRLGHIIGPLATSRRRQRRSAIWARCCGAASADIVA